MRIESENPIIEESKECELEEKKDGLERTKFVIEIFVLQLFLIAIPLFLKACTGWIKEI